MPLVLRHARILACVLAVSASIHAQQNLHGKVLDPLGAAVPNASVELLKPGPAHQTISGPDGAYALPASCPCTLRVTAPTFPATIVTLPENPKYADLTLQTPTRTDQVTVTETGTPAPLARSGTPISVLTESADYPHSLEIQQPLRLIPGVQITTNGQRGGESSLFLRGGNSGLHQGPHRRRAR